MIKGQISMGKTIEIERTETLASLELPGVRLNNYDLARSFAMFMVILNHVADYYLSRTSQLRLTVLLMEGISHCAIPIFLMLTGALVLEKSLCKDWRTFYIRAFRKLMIPTLLFSSIYIIFDILRGEMTFATALDCILHGMIRYYPTWYMFMLVGIYLMLPFVAIIKKHIGNKGFCMFSLIYFVWAMVSKQLDTYSTSYSIGIVFGFMGFVLLGNVIDKEISANNKRGYLCLVFGGLLLLIDYMILFFYMKNGGEYHTKILMDYSAPLQCAGSILAFCGFRMIKISRSFEFVSRHSFTVYLSHIIILKILNYVLFGIFNIGIPVSTGGLIIVMILSVIVTYIGALIVSIVFDKYYYRLFQQRIILNE